MKLRITAPQSIQPCTIDLPPSKSIANRVLILSALNGVEPGRVLHQPLSDLCDDIRVVAEMLQHESAIVDVCAAGTAMRFGTAYLAVCNGTHTITGTQRLQERPIGILVDALRTLGATIEYTGKEGFPPLRITGNQSLRGGCLTMNGGVSSQFISALLMIAPTMQDGLTLKLEGQLVSTPYLYITMELMRKFGASVDWTDQRTIRVEHGYNYNPQQAITIEADWTAASYWYEIASIAGIQPTAFRPQSLIKDSIQGDRVCDDIFNLLHQQQAKPVTGSPSNEPELVPKAFTYDFEDCPDLVQTLVVTCCMNALPFRFTGLRTLRIKETDRISALQTELAKMGFGLEATDDSLTWDGHCEATKDPFTIATYHDHRMAMSFAPCALRLGEITIEDPSVVNKSYPTYWSDLEKIGFQLCYIS